MAIESSPLPPPTASDRVSAIENEIPAYRAISPLAVVSVIFGLVSVLCFADSWFLIAAALAVVFGLVAGHKIRRYPDVLTGRALAQAGVGLGLAFGLSSVTIGQLNNLILHQKASAFGQTYAKALATNSLADALWYKVPPQGRNGKTPRELMETSEKNSPSKDAFQEYVGDLQKLHDRLALPGAKLTFEKVEKSGSDRMSPYAVLLYKISGGTPPPHDESTASADHDHAHDAPPPDQYAAVEVKADTETGPYAWYVHAVSFPYTLNSHTLAVKAVDDGHGHSH